MARFDLQTDLRVLNRRRNPLLDLAGESHESYQLIAEIVE
jgi:hypothetical protein